MEIFSFRMLIFYLQNANFSCRIPFGFSKILQNANIFLQDAIFSCRTEMLFFKVLQDIYEFLQDTILPIFDPPEYNLNLAEWIQK